MYFPEIFNQEVSKNRASTQRALVGLSDTPATI
jgi:hypothetical protein